jgi:hypothetical protein
MADKAKKRLATAVSTPVQPELRTINTGFK